MTGLSCDCWHCYFCTNLYLNKKKLEINKDKSLEESWDSQSARCRMSCLFRKENDNKTEQFLYCLLAGIMCLFICQPFGYGMPSQFLQKQFYSAYILPSSCHSNRCIKWIVFFLLPLMTFLCDPHSPLLITVLATLS